MRPPWSRSPRAALARARGPVRTGRSRARGGIVHRDFKPSNVLVDAGGRVVVTDFGLAASMEVADESLPEDRSGSLLVHALSATATPLGTPAYMAPEQFAGQRARPAADQFAFCVALVESLAGKRPFRGESVEAWTRSQARGPDLTGLPGPGRLARVLARGLAFAPGDRYPTMRALLAELRRCQNQRRRLTIGVVTTAVGAVLAGNWLASLPPSACADPLAARASVPTGQMAAAVQIGEAWALARLGRHGESERACAAAIAELTALLGPSHPHTADAEDTCRLIADERAGVERD